MSEVQISGDLPGIIKNEDRLYDGDLVSYCQVLFFNANNLNNPYHNFRHMSHVLWLCHDACRYYQNELPPGRMRVLLVAAMFHDFDHPGHPHPGEHDPDRINIPIAIAGLRRFAMAEDRVLLPEIEATIEATHYPYKTAAEELDPLGKIIRDADLAQALSPVWIQQVVIGLAAEWRMKPLDVLKMQESFLANLPFNTEWARSRFPEALVQAKIEEVQKLLRILETGQGSTAPQSAG